MESVDFFLIVMGLALLYAPFELTREMRHRYMRSAHAIGRVIGHVGKASVFGGPGGPWQHGGPGTRHARIAFEANGEQHECIASIGASWIMHDVGDAVEVSYDPDNPANADIVYGEGAKMLEKLIIRGLPLAGVVCLIVVALRVLG